MSGYVYYGHADIRAQVVRDLVELGGEASMQALRWQVADAIAASQPEGALGVVSTLLADSTPGVRSSAALAPLTENEPSYHDFHGGAP